MPHSPYQCRGLYYANSPDDKRAEIEIHKRLFSEYNDTMFQFELENPYQLSKIEMIFPILDQLANSKKITVVDAGCGVGKSLALLEKRYPKFRFVGFDISPEGCQLAKQRTNALLFQGDAENMPIKSESAEVVLHIATMHHFFRYPEQALRESFRVLKQNGILLITDPNVSTERPEIQERVNKIRDHTVAILDLLDEMLRPLRKFPVSPSALPKNPTDSVTEKPIPLDFLKDALTSCGFSVVKCGFLNYTTFETRRYHFGWDIAEAIDRYLTEVAPKSAAQVYLIVKKEGKTQTRIESVPN